VVDYFVGLKIYDTSDKKTKKSYLWISILFNLGLLGFFKYFNFFIDSWIDFLAAFGYEHQSTWTLKVILPVGISFYTFQTISYSLDIYFKNVKPTKDFISFASFVSFFPQLVAGPIERASNLLPQILKRRIFKYEQGVHGLRLILYGMFKKIVIADSLSWRVDSVFNNYQNLDGGVLLLGLIYFSFQIYCDFSGYSDIAIGTSKLFGFELMSNFKFPYFSRDIGEFWRRWHISLSTWFRDYLYIRLGGSKGGKLLSIRNIFIIFIVSGFWHGANWTFIAWGMIHAILYIPLFLIGKNRKYGSHP
jgi:D-alanyl-lipoteichoic acid acyltransferase DltB (MBOAT superfamily)